MKDRIGKFYLRQRAGRSIEICWTDDGGKSHAVSTRTADYEEATMALAAHAYASGATTKQWRQVLDPKLAFVLEHYRSGKGDRMASIGTFDMAVRDVLEICGDITVSQFNVAMQVRFVEELRKRRIGDATIQRKLSALRPAFVRARKDELLTEIPPSAGADDWSPQIKARTAPLAVKCETRIGSNSFVLALATAGRRVQRVTERMLASIGITTTAIANWASTGLRMGGPKAARLITGGDPQICES